MQIEEYFSQNNPLSRWKDHSILIALSGGADSTALLRLFHHFQKEFDLKLFAAHANHQLRGEESDSDENFVDELCRKFNIPCVIKRLSIERTSEGLEADARRARYAFLEKTAEELGCRYVATAHHRNDQIETILYRILRGTGIAGLAGMARCRKLNEAVTLIRPLLSFSRDEILSYLERTGQEWRTDSTNFSENMFRNRLRHQLIPFLKKEFSPNLEKSLERLGNIAESAQNFINSQKEFLAKKAVVSTAAGIKIFPKNSPETEKFLWSELLRRIWQENALPQQSMGQKEWDLMTAMLLREKGTPEIHIFPGNVEVHRETDTLRIRFAKTFPKNP